MRGLFAAVLAASFAFSTVATGHGGGGGGGGHGGGGYYGGFFYVGGGGLPPIPESETGNYDAIHSVAMISVLGPGMSVIGIGPAPTETDISAWHVDDLVASTMKKYLGNRFAFTDIAFDRAAILAVPSHLYREKKTLEYLGRLSNAGVDAFVLVRPAGSELYPRGIGLQATPSLQTVLWTNFEIDIIDAHTMAYIGKAFARIENAAGQPPQFAVRSVPVSTLSVGRGLTPAESGLLEREMQDLLPRAMVETLRSLNLGVPLPAIGDHAVSTPALATTMQDIKSVAVVSAIGDTLQLINPGNMFSKKSDTNVSFGAAGIDETAEETVKGVLSRHYAIKPANVDRASLAHLLVTPGMPVPRLGGLAPRTDIDAYVVLLRGTHLAAVRHGIGIGHWTPVFNPETSVFADYAIVVVDARSLRTMAASTVGAGPSPPCARPQAMPYGGLNIPACKIDEKLWPEGGTLSVDTAAEVRNSLMTLMSSGIPPTLYDLGLDPQVQAAAHTP